MPQDDQQPKRYSRSAHIKGLPQPGEDTAETTTDAPRVVEHAKKGFTALHKVIALISTCLSVIVASITISNNLNKDKAATTPSSETRVTHIYKTETTVVSGSQSHPSENQGQKQATSRTEAGSAQTTQQAPSTSQSQTPASSATPGTSSRQAPSQTASSTTRSISPSSEASNSSAESSTQSSEAQNESATMTGSSEVVGTNGSGSE